ncbi:unnamed protein product [Amoebophrya sp. A120]|nr:unnamed protein product [Amoebophrya sp. A120]|eukprot:GSA120T00019357001.1
MRRCVLMRRCVVLWHLAARGPPQVASLQQHGLERRDGVRTNHERQHDAATATASQTRLEVDLDAESGSAEAAGRADSTFGSRLLRAELEENEAVDGDEHSAAVDGAATATGENRTPVDDVDNHSGLGATTTPDGDDEPDATTTTIEPPTSAEEPVSPSSTPPDSTSTTDPDEGTTTGTDEIPDTAVELDHAGRASDKEDVENAEKEAAAARPVEEAGAVPVGGATATEETDGTNSKQTEEQNDQKNDKSQESESGRAPEPGEIETPATDAPPDSSTTASSTSEAGGSSSSTGTFSKESEDTSNRATDKSKSTSTVKNTKTVESESSEDQNQNTSGSGAKNEKIEADSSSATSSSQSAGEQEVDTRTAGASSGEEAATQVEDPPGHADEQDVELDPEKESTSKQDSDRQQSDTTSDLKNLKEDQDVNLDYIPHLHTERHETETSAFLQQEDEAGALATSRKTEVMISSSSSDAASAVSTARGAAVTSASTLQKTSKTKTAAWDLCQTTENPYCFASGYEVKKVAAVANSWKGAAKCTPEDAISNKHECLLAIAYLCKLGVSDACYVAADDTPFTEVKHETKCVKNGSICHNNNNQQLYPEGCGVLHPKSSGDERVAVFWTPTKKVGSATPDLVPQRTHNVAVCRTKSRQTAPSVVALTDFKEYQTPKSGNLNHPIDSTGNTKIGHSAVDPISGQAVGADNEKILSGLNVDECRLTVGTPQGKDDGIIRFAKFTDPDECKTYLDYFPDQTVASKTPPTAAFAFDGPGSGGCALNWMSDKAFLAVGLAEPDTTHTLFERKWTRLHFFNQERHDCEIACKELWSKFPYAPNLNRRPWQGCSYIITRKGAADSSDYTALCQIHPVPGSKGAPPDLDVNVEKRMFWFANLPLHENIDLTVDDTPDTACGFDVKKDVDYIQRASASFESWDYTGIAGTRNGPDLRVAHVPYYNLERGFSGCPVHFNTPNLAECESLTKLFSNANRKDTGLIEGIHTGGAMTWQEVPEADKRKFVQDCGLLLDAADDTLKFHFNERWSSPVFEDTIDVAEKSSDQWRICMGTCGSYADSFLPFQPQVYADAKAIRQTEKTAMYAVKSDEKCMASTSTTDGVYFSARDPATVGNFYDACCVPKKFCDMLFDLEYCETLFERGWVPAANSSSVLCDADPLAYYGNVCKEQHKDTCCRATTQCVDFFTVLRCYDTSGPNMVPITDETVQCNAAGGMCVDYPDNNTCCMEEGMLQDEAAQEAELDLLPEILTYGGSTVLVFVLITVIALQCREDPLAEFKKRLEEQEGDSDDDDDEDSDD